MDSNYLKETHQKCPLLCEFNGKVKSEEIVDRVMTSNGLDFLARFYRD